MACPPQTTQGLADRKSRPRAAREELDVSRSRRRLRPRFSPPRDLCRKLPGSRPPEAWLKTTKLSTNEPAGHEARGPKAAPTPSPPRPSPTCTRSHKRALTSIASLVATLIALSLNAQNAQNTVESQIESLNAQVAEFNRAGRYTEAVPIAQRALELAQSRLGPDHPKTATELNNLALLYKSEGEYEKALPVFQRALTIAEEAIGPDHPDTATILNNLAELYRSQGAYEKALPLHQRALAIREKARGPDHPDTAGSLNNLATLYAWQGEYEKAVPLCQRAVTILEKVLGPDNLDTAAALNTLGELYKLQGAYAKALPLLQRSLDIKEKKLGVSHPDLADSLNSVAELYRLEGEFEKALPLYQRALAIREQVLGPSHPDTASVLNNLADLYQSVGASEKALPLYQRALAIAEKALGPGHPATATTLGNLALVYESQGAYEQALPLFQRALAIREETLGAGHPDTALALSNLAMLYQAQGASEKALPLYQRALPILEKALGPDHPETAVALSNLATLYQAQGASEKALPLYQRALAIDESALGPVHPHTATVLDNLAGLYESQGSYERALPLYQRALAIREQSLGPWRPDTAFSLNNLAWLYDSQGAYKKAWPLHERALGIMEKALGPDHPDTRTALANMRASTLYRTHLDERACGEYGRLLEQERPHLARSLAGGWEPGMRNVVRNLQTHLAEFTACMAAHPSLAATGVQVVLDTKARLLEELQNAINALARRSELDVKAMLEEYFETARRLARLQHNAVKQPSAEIREALTHTAAQEDTLRAQILARSPAYMEVVQNVSVADVRQALKPAQALVEMIHYTEAYVPPRRGQRWGPDRYGAFLMTRSAVTWRDLGPAADIDLRARKLLVALCARENGTKARRLAGELYRQVWAQFERPLASAHEIFFAADGLLRLVPLTALVDPSGHYLIEGERRFYQIGTGRDLVLWADTWASQKPPQIVANPDFGVPEAGGFRFDPLPGAEAEALGISELFPLAERIEADAATPAGVESLVAPRFLHLATHGFYEPPDESTSAGDPSLRAGIALAGANRGPEGILRANEVAGMNLRGTGLVVVSACETGLGEVSYADGVFGLQRSLTLAGARTQVLSLWPVDDGKTADLMIQFYRNLKDGKSKSDALREAQLAQLRNGEPPSVWAAFVAFGDPGKLGR